MCTALVGSTASAAYDNHGILVGGSQSEILGNDGTSQVNDN